MVRRLVVSCVFLVAFAAQVAARPLPRHRPRDFSIDYQNTGGMRPDGDHAVLARASTYEHTTAPTMSTTFTLTSRELDALYQRVRRARVDTIRFQKAQIYDAGSVTITITAGGHTWSLVDNGRHTPVAHDAPRLDDVAAAIDELVGKHVQRSWRHPPSDPISE